MVSSALIAWLRDSDPALRWQVERDLMHEPPEVWQVTRARTATEGFGARLLALDAPAGKPSKWLTLFGVRVLAWWDSAHQEVQVFQAK